MAKCGKRLFNEKEKQFLIDNVLGKSVYELANIFNKNFNRNITPKEIYNWKCHNKIKSGTSNKFKKGQKPYNTLPIGSETTYYDKNIKMTYIKIGEPNVWELKQVYLYKKYIGDVPPKHSVIFLDGNRENFDLSNLALVTYKERNTMAMSQYYYNEKELTKIGILLAKLKLKTWDRMRGD